MGRDSNSTGGQKQAKYKAKASHSHDHMSSDEPKVCAGCRGSHRAHTCSNRGLLSRLKRGGGFAGLFAAPATATAAPTPGAAGVTTAPTAVAAATATASPTPGAAGVTAAPIAVAAATVTAAPTPGAAGVTAAPTTADAATATATPTPGAAGVTAAPTPYAGVNEPAVALHGAGGANSSSSSSSIVLSSPGPSSEALVGAAAARVGTEVTLLPALMRQLELLRRRMPDVRRGVLVAPPGGNSSVVGDFRRDFELKTMCYECPSSDYTTAPSVDIAACRGVKIFAVRWQLHDGNIQLRCRCGGVLIGKRWSISQPDGKFKRMVIPGGVRGVAVHWVEECPIPGAADCCKTSDGNRQTYSAIEAYILRQVEVQAGRHVRRLYPVETGYASRPVLFHLTEHASKALELQIVTYVPGEVLAKNIKISFKEMYDEDAADYTSHVGRFNAQRARLGQEPRAFGVFPPFSEWVGREFVDGAALCSLYTEAWWQERRDLRNIELQQVRVRRIATANGEICGSVSLDHTFASMKNVHQPADLPVKLTALLDMVDNDTGEVIFGVCVTDTSGGEGAHALSSLTLLRDEKYGVLFTDTWPNEKAVLHLLLSFSHGRLDVWHWMKRITMWLLESHYLYGAALYGLSEVIFIWDVDDISDVEEALSDRTLNGHEHTPAEIDELKKSGVFWDRYCEYTRKTMHKRVSTMVKKARAWETKYANADDPKSSRKMALSGFAAAFALQLERIGDLIDMADHNVELRPKPGSKHKLRRYRSTRGAKVEVIHGPSKRFANQDSVWRLFQALHMEGYVRMNAERREEAKQLVGPDGDDSARAATRVPHFRPWLLQERNRLALAAGHPLPYPDECVHLPPDNGELFLMEYAYAQAARRTANGGAYTANQIIAAGGCPCVECTAARAGPCSLCGIDGACAAGGLCAAAAASSGAADTVAGVPSPVASPAGPAPGGGGAEQPAPRKSPRRSAPPRPFLLPAPAAPSTHVIPPAAMLRMQLHIRMQMRLLELQLNPTLAQPVPSASSVSSSLPAPSARPPAKKSKQRAACDCGALALTQEARAAHLAKGGPGGPGGFKAPHKKACSWKLSVSGP